MSTISKGRFPLVSLEQKIVNSDRAGMGQITNPSSDRIDAGSMPLVYALAGSVGSVGVITKL